MPRPLSTTGGRNRRLCTVTLISVGVASHGFIDGICPPPPRRDGVNPMSASGGRCYIAGRKAHGFDAAKHSDGFRVVLMARSLFRLRLLGDFLFVAIHSPDKSRTRPRAKLRSFAPGCGLRCGRSKKLAIEGRRGVRTCSPTCRLTRSSTGIEGSGPSVRRRNPSECLAHRSRAPAPRDVHRLHWRHGFTPSRLGGGGQFRR